MSEQREFPTEVIASISSGILLCSFSEMHEAAEFLMGHPIWTHHFASPDIWKRMTDRVLQQHPLMPKKLDVTGVTPENWLEYKAKLIKSLGAIVRITKGDGSTEKSPLDGIPEGKPIIILASSES